MYCIWSLFFNDCMQSIGFFWGGVVVSNVLEQNFYYIITLDLFVFQIADKKILTGKRVL